jgi:hypothetical protein
MERKRALLIAVWMMVSLLPVGAQVSVGLKGGINNTEMAFDSEAFRSDNRLGWFVGPMVTVKLPIIALGFDIAALYDVRHAKINNETIQQKSIIVPVNGRLTLGFGEEGGIFFSAGPQFGFNVGDDEFYWKDKNSYQNTFQLKKSFLSVNIGGGIRFGHHLEVAVTRNVSVTNTADATLKGVLSAVAKDDTKSKSWAFSATYYF